MKETSLLDVLLLLVANHIAEKTEAEREKLKAELEEAGIPFAKLIKIASWLKDMLQSVETQDSSQQAVRVFTEEECEKMDIITRGCICFLEKTGALNSTMREWIIEHAMDLEVDQVTIEELQHLLSLVLFQQYGQANLLKSNQNKSLIITNPQAVH